MSGGESGGNSNPNKIKGGRWTVVKFFSISVSCAQSPDELPTSEEHQVPVVLLLRSRKFRLLPAAGFHYGLDANHLPTWILQDLVWPTSAIADEHCLLLAKHTPPWLVESVR